MPAHSWFGLLITGFLEIDAVYGENKYRLLEIWKIWWFSGWFFYQKEPCNKIRSGKKSLLMVFLLCQFILLHIIFLNWLLACKREYLLTCPLYLVFLELIIDRGIFDSDKYWQLLLMDLSYSCIIVDLGGSLSHVLLCCYVNIIFCRLLILHWFCESIERLIALNISRHCNLQVFYHNGLVRDFTVYWHWWDYDKLQS